MTVTVHHGDSRDVLKSMPDCSISAIVCDPPYSLQTINKRFAKVGRNDKTFSKSGPHQRTARGFMNQKWDTGETAFDSDFWHEALRVLKPGGHVVAFGGTRTYHRLACAIEDAGFEIRDMLAWLYGSGFPKSHDVAKGIDKAAGRELEIVPIGKPVKRMIPGAEQARDGWEKNNGREYQPGQFVPSDEAAPWEGWGTALKPALEPICFARKPLIGTVAANVLEHGTGALNIEACRVAGAPEPTRFDPTKHSHNGWRMDATGEECAANASPLGRWPANVVHDGSDEVVAAFPQSAGQQADASASASASARTSQNVYGAMKKGNGREGEASADRRYAGDGSTNFAALPGTRRGDSGSAARFFYSSKADADDRLGSKHPTVKPVDLMRWLVRLVTPPGGLVLDPFAGSGTTGMACLAEGFDCILVEREAEYVADIRRRIDHVSGADTPLFATPNNDEAV